MTYAIVYSSRTGNTKKLASTLWDALPRKDCVYCGGPNDDALSADRLYVGFWTDKGSCDGETEQFLQKIQGKEVFLFGTAGFGGDAAYFERILNNVRRHLTEDNTVVGSYMCQGRMPMAVRERYEKMLAGPSPIPNLEGMIKNFDAALSHPDSTDLERFKKAALAAED